jgi:hypothetical protein
MNKTRRTRRGGGWFSSKKPVAPTPVSTSVPARKKWFSFGKKSAPTPVVATPAPVPVAAPEPNDPNAPSVDRLKKIVDEYEKQFTYFRMYAFNDPEKKGGSNEVLLQAYDKYLDTLIGRKKAIFQWYQSVFPEVQSAAQYVSNSKNQGRSNWKLDTLESYVNSFNAIGADLDSYFKQIVEDATKRIEELSPKQGGRRRGKTAKRRRRA